MQTNKRFKWTGNFRDQRSGKYRVWWSSGAWTLSYDGTRLSRHISSEQAKRKAANHQKARPSKAKTSHIRTQTRHDIAASVVRHSNLSKEPLATVDPVKISALAGYKATVAAFAKAWSALFSKLSGIDDRATDLTLLKQIFTNVSEATSRIDLDLPDEDRAARVLASVGPSDVLASAGPSNGRPLEPLQSLDRAGREFDALEYELARNADPDPRDDEDQEIEGLIIRASASLAEECAHSEETPILIARGRDKDEDRTIFANEAAP